MRPNEFWCAVQKIHDEWFIGASHATMKAGAHALDRLLDNTEDEPWVCDGLAVATTRRRVIEGEKATKTKRGKCAKKST